MGITKVMKHCTIFQGYAIIDVREVFTSYFIPSTPLGSTISVQKYMDPHILTPCKSSKGNEASYKVSKAM